MESDSEGEESFECLPTRDSRRAASLGSRQPIGRAAYWERLQQYGMTASMSRKGHCDDNAMMESWHSLLKKELI
ncbi:hypothetical protein TPY_1291 [Sulfobacillus acidophilus TPY]|nr:hypothetical protein TPY_1291 [Sulfobacillus acidophilus TPY]